MADDRDDLIAFILLGVLAFSEGVLIGMAVMLEVIGC